MLTRLRIVTPALGIALALAGPGYAASVVDTTFVIDASNPNWQSTGIDIRQGDYVWLFSFGAAVTHGLSCGSHIGAYLVSSDNNYGGGMTPAPNCGAGAVFKVGGDTAATALPAIAHIMNPWSRDSGELLVGFNDNYHADNSGTLVIGAIRARDSVSVQDTTCLLNSQSSSWQGTGVTVQPGDYLFLFSFGAAVTHGLSCGLHLGAYLAYSDNSYGGGMTPAPNCGAGVVYKVGGDTGATALPTFAHIMNPWSRDSGELLVGFNDNYHADNSGTLVVGIVKIRLPPAGVGTVHRSDTKGLTFTALPNPAGSRVRLQLDVPRSCHVSLKVMDAQGRVVRTLTEGNVGAGSYVLCWDGKDDLGSRVPPGTYIGQLRAGGSVCAQKLVKLNY